MNNKKPLGIKDVAKHANVAIATVDRVIHDRKGVSKKTKRKVLKVIEELNFQPNIMASNLAKNKAFSIGVLLPNVSAESSYWELPLKGIVKAQKELQRYTIEIDIYQYDPSNSSEIRKQILKVINSNIDGLVLAPKFSQEIQILLQDCHEKNRPYVFIDSDLPEMNSLCSIQQPIYEGGQLAAQLFNYCIDDGKVLILHFKDQMDTEPIINLTEKGMVDYLNEIDSSITTTKEVISLLEVDKINDSITGILEENPDVRGIFVPNSKIHHIAKYLDNKSIREIYLIGYDLLIENHEFIERGVIDFLICSKPEEQGYQALYKLFESLVLKKVVTKEVTMPLDIITRMNYKYY